MKAIDESRLETDLDYRIEYLSEFLGLTADDIAAIHGAAPLLDPLVPELVNAVYDKLFGYDCTKRHFVPRQAGYAGAVPADIESLSMDHPQVQFRKQHLGHYLRALVTRPYDGRMFRYLDNVGKIHTPQAGSPALDVPLVQMNALLGFVADALTATVLGLGLEGDLQARTLRAFGKLLWLQNDLIVRHYAAA